MNTIKSAAILALAGIFATASCGRSDVMYKTVTAQGDEPVTLRQCFDSDGVQVRARFIGDRGAVQSDDWGAMSQYTPVSGPLVTFYNIGNIDGQVLSFAWEHECAHHRLGHAREVFLRQMAGEMPAPNQAHQYEYEADCAAVSALSAAGMLDENRLRQIMAKFPDIQDSPTHPTPDKRVHNALACLR